MKKRIALAVLVVAVSAVAAVLYSRTRTVRLPPSPPVARVDDTVISSRQLDIRLAQILPVMSFHGNIDPSRLLSLKRAALDELILDELIFREAERRGQSASEAAVEAALEETRSRFATRGEYEAALAQNGMTEKSFRRYTEKNVLVRQARQANAQLAVTDADAQAYYEENTGAFLRPEQAHLLEMLVKVDPADPNSAGPAERNARRLANRVRAGEAFDKLASEHSEDDYRVKGGDLGFVHRGRLDADLEAAVFAAPPGEVRIHRSIYGFHVFKVLERQAPTQLAFSEARPLIVQRLTAERRERAERSWHEALLGPARIVILDAALRDAAPAQLPAFRSSKAMSPR